MPDRHALLGASSAHRWLTCTPSARLCENIPDVTTSYAAEGTQAHAICEALLAQLLGNDVEIPEPADAEMERCTLAYRDFVEEELNAAKAKTKDACLLIEQELDFSDYVPEGFGTSDAVIVGDDTLEVIDFKYGKGVQVNVNNNPQLRLYALGAYLALGSLYDFTWVKAVVFQPRVDNVAYEKISVEELLNWAYEYVKPRAELAFQGEGVFCVGEHCRFCKVGGTCRARAEEAFKIVELADTQPATIDDEEIPAILDKLDNAEKWIEAMRKYAETKAISEGKKWPGYKIVEGRTIRKISDQFAALDALINAGFDQEEVTTTKLKGITDLEKTLGKSQFNQLLGDLVVKPQGAPTLVKESDRRPEFNPVAEAFKEEI